MLRRLLTATVDAVRTTVAAPGPALATVLVSSVALTMVGVALLASTQTDQMRAYWDDSIEVSVFLCAADSPAPVCGGSVNYDQRARIASTLDELSIVSEVEFESSQQAYVQFQGRYGGSELAERIDPDSLPESFRVRLREPTAAHQVVAAVASLDGVEQVVDQREMLDDFFTTLTWVQRVALGFALVQAAAAVVLIAHSVHSAVALRQSEVRIMRLIGAKRRTIRAPFVLVSVVQAVVGAALSGAVLLTAYRMLLQPQVGSAPDAVASQLTRGDVEQVVLQQLALAVVVAYSVARLALRRHLRS